MRFKAAQKAGVEHIYYTSLAFGPESNAGVMRAHLRTEAFLKGLGDIKFTIIREGCTMNRGLCTLAIMILRTMSAATLLQQVMG